MTRVVVVGNGMAGSRFVAELHARDTRREMALTVFGAEPCAPYNRVLLSDVLAGTAALGDIELASRQWYADAGVTLHEGLGVTGIDRGRRVVHAADGSETPYDVLVLATGSRPRVPALDGLQRADGSLLPGAAVFRTVSDCETILATAGESRRAVVLGGGLLGLEAARGLVRRGLEVTVVHGAGHLMERQLDPAAGRVLTRRLRELGVAISLGSRAAGVTGAERVSGVRLADGTTLPADLLVLACGVTPETRLAAEAGLAVRNGVLVDDTLHTSDPHIRAIGECAEHDGRTYGIVAPGWEQARVLADLLTGADDARYTGSTLVTRLKAAGVDLAAMGDASACEHDVEDGTEVLHFSDPARGTYKKVVIRDDRLVGAILLGDIGTVGTVTQIFDRGAAVPVDRLSLLFDRVGSAPVETPARIPDRATVCQCNGVTKGAITAAYLDGARTVEAVAAQTRATTGCGTCRSTVCGLLGWLEAADPEAPPVVVAVAGSTSTPATATPAGVPA